MSGVPQWILFRLRRLYSWSCPLLPRLREMMVLNPYIILILDLFGYTTVPRPLAHQFKVDYALRQGPKILQLYRVYHTWLARWHELCAISIMYVTFIYILPCWYLIVSQALSWQSNLSVSFSPSFRHHCPIPFDFHAVIRYHLSISNSNEKRSQMHNR